MKASQKRKRQVVDDYFKGQPGTFEGKPDLYFKAWQHAQAMDRIADDFSGDDRRGERRDFRAVASRAYDRLYQYVQARLKGGLEDTGE